MPYGLKRFQQAESLHFITFSYSTTAIPQFLSIPDAQVRSSRQQTWTVDARARQLQARSRTAYVVMPEHLHLLMNEPPAILVDQFL